MVPWTSVLKQRLARTYRVLCAIVTYPEMLLFFKVPIFIIDTEFTQLQQADLSSVKFRIVFPLISRTKFNKKKIKKLQFLDVPNFPNF